MIARELGALKRSMELFTVHDLINMYKKGQILLRESSQYRVRLIKNYLSENALTGNIFMPPLVANIRKGQLTNKSDVQLSIIDGAQRMKAFVQIEDDLIRKLSQNTEKGEEAYKLLHLLQETYIVIQVFENLTEEEEAQLFIDMNVKGKKVALSKRISFDSRNHLNVITNQILNGSPQLKIAGVELEKVAIIRPRNTNLLSLSQLRQIIDIFITGKFNSIVEDQKKTTPLETSSYIKLIYIWLDELFKLHPAQTIGNYNISMIASYPVLIAIALYANDKMESQPYEKRKEMIIARMTRLREMDWSPENELWKKFHGVIRGGEGLYFLTNNKSNRLKLVQTFYEFRK